MALQFTAVNSTGRWAKAGPDGSARTLTAVKDSVVTFQLNADATIDSPKITRQESAQPIQIEFEIAADQKSAKAKYTVTEFGTFVASAAVGGAQTSEADAVVKLAEATSPAAPNEGQGVNDKPSELEVGEFDRGFALWTLAILALISAALVAGVWFVISRVLLPATGVLIPQDQVVDGTFGQRAAFIVLVIGAGVGGITLLIGAWLAALETRGRLRLNLDGKDAAKGPETAHLVEIIEKVRRLRGSMAVVIAGGLIVVLAMWGVSPMASPETPSSTASATATPSVTAARTPSASPSAGQPSPDDGSMTPTPVPTPSG